MRIACIVVANRLPDCRINTADIVHRVINLASCRLLQEPCQAILRISASPILNKGKRLIKINFLSQIVDNNAALFFGNAEEVLLIGGRTFQFQTDVCDKLVGIALFIFQVAELRKEIQKCFFVNKQGGQ